MAWNKAVPASSTEVSSSCAQFQANWKAIAVVASAQHGEISLTTAVHSAGLCEVLYVGTTAQVAALSPVACACAWNTTLADVFTFTALASSNGGGFVPSGTKMLFYANVAPTYWTIDATVNDVVAFITKGSVAGGQTGGGVHSTGTWTQTTHTHTIDSHTHGGVTGSVTAAILRSYGPTGYVLTETHTHTITAQAEMTSDINAVVTAWRPAAYCYIVCTKN